MKPLIGPRFRKILLTLAILAPIVVTLWIASLQSEENGTVVELDLATGQLHTEWQLFGLILSENFEDTWVSRNAKARVFPSGRYKTIRRGPVLPALSLVRTYPNYRWGTMLSDLQLMKNGEELECCTSEANTQAAVTIITLWCADDAPDGAMEYVNEVSTRMLAHKLAGTKLDIADLPTVKTR